MRVHTTESAESSGSDADALKIRKLDTPVVAHHDVLNVALAINERANLSACFVRQLAELASKFRSDDLVWGYAPSVQLFDAPQLIWF